MSDEWTENFETVEEHIKKVRRILTTENYTFEFQETRRGEDPLDPFNNKNTLLSLDYDEEDVMSEIKGLEVCFAREKCRRMQ